MGFQEFLRVLLSLSTLKERIDTMGTAIQHLQAAVAHLADSDTATKAKVAALSQQVKDLQALLGGDDPNVEAAASALDAIAADLDALSAPAPAPVQVPDPAQAPAAAA